MPTPTSTTRTAFPLRRLRRINTASHSADPSANQKIFGFFSWENFSFRKGNPILTTVPTTAMQRGNFGALCSSYDGNGVCTAGHGNQLYDPLTTCGVAGAPACPAGQTTVRKPFADNKIPIGRFDSAAEAVSRLLWIAERARNGQQRGLPLNNFATNSTSGR